jgi:hypothetical protein
MLILDAIDGMPELLCPTTGAGTKNSPSVALRATVAVPIRARVFVFIILFLHPSNVETALRNGHFSEKNFLFSRDE